MRAWAPSVPWRGLDDQERWRLGVVVVLLMWVETGAGLIAVDLGAGCLGYLLWVGITAPRS